MTYATLITVFPLLSPPVCACEYRQGNEDGWRGVSYVRVFNACTGGEMVRRFVLEDERYRASRVHAGWLP